jgi:predicted esterase
LIAHGTEDPVVNYTRAVESVKELRALNYTVTFKTYQGLKHEVSSDEVKLLARFLKKVIPRI